MGRQICPIRNTPRLQLGSGNEVGVKPIWVDGFWAVALDPFMNFAAFSLSRHCFD